jgi:hypothetical protein
VERPREHAHGAANRPGADRRRAGTRRGLAVGNVTRARTSQA